MFFRNIPEDINVELLLSYFPRGKCKVAFKGLHKRNSYNDIIHIEEEKDESLFIGIGRNSLYNELPESMFHPVNRFENIRKSEDKKRFEEEYQKQEQEKENAYKFFEPLDLFLLNMRLTVREHLNEFVENDKVLIDIISDQLTEEQRNNRFIKQTVIFLPLCKRIRGDITFLTFMLRKIFMEERLKIEKHQDILSYIDDIPRYSDGLDSTLGDAYLGNSYDELTTIYDIYYWSDNNCDENFPKFIDDIESFRNFVQDYFFSIEETLKFNIYKNEDSLEFMDENTFYYLNYNTIL